MAPAPVLLVLLMTYSRDLLNSASPVLVTRVSTTVPVSVQVWLTSLWMFTVVPPAGIISAHQEPSLYQTLLCGLSAVAAVAPVEYRWSWYQVGAAAWAGSVTSDARISDRTATTPVSRACRPDEAGLSSVSNLRPRTSVFPWMATALPELM